MHKTCIKDYRNKFPPLINDSKRWLTFQFLLFQSIDHIHVNEKEISSTDTYHISLHSQHLQKKLPEKTKRSYHNGKVIRYALFYETCPREMRKYPYIQYFVTTYIVCVSIDVFHFYYLQHRSEYSKNINEVLRGNDQAPNLYIWNRSLVLP